MTGPATVIVIALLVAAALSATWPVRRVPRGVQRRSIARQAVCALLLGLALMPPRLPSPDDALVVWTAGASPSAWRTWLWPQPAVALPEASVPADIDRTPDLETALRRHPATRRLDVHGDGLPGRDQAAASHGPLTFTAAPPRGLLALQAPTTVPVGSQWSVDGRAAAPVVRAELRDPGGALVDAVALADGRFRLSGVAKAAGLVRFELRLLDATGSAVDTASVPLQARTGAAMTVIVRAGAPDPELKYWRRWAVDAGMQLHLAAALGPAMDVHDGEAALTPAALAAADLVVVDARAWASLSADESAALRSAVRQGLGLLLRCSGPLDPPIAADWAAFGFALEPAADAEAVPVTLDARTGLRTAGGEHIDYTAAPVRIGLTAGTLPLLRSDAGDVLAAARDMGDGRVAVWRLQDSYRLQLAGEPARYGRLWADTLARIARPRPRPQEAMAEPLPGERWVGERTVLCGLGASAAIVDAQGGRGATLPVDGSGCAVDYPASAGWQRLVSAGTTQPFFVRDADDAAGLRGVRDREATVRLAQGRQAARSGPPPDGATRALPRWPFALAWLASYAWLLWRERSGR